MGLLVLDWCIVELLQGLFLRRELPFPIRDDRSFPPRVFVLADYEHSQLLHIGSDFGVVVRGFRENSLKLPCRLEHFADVHFFSCEASVAFLVEVS